MDAGIIRHHARSSRTVPTLITPPHMSLFNFHDLGSKEVALKAPANKHPAVCACLARAPSMASHQVRPPATAPRALITLFQAPHRKTNSHLRA